MWLFLHLDSRERVTQGWWSSLGESCDVVCLHGINKSLNGSKEYETWETVCLILKVTKNFKKPCNKEIGSAQLLVSIVLDGQEVWKWSSHMSTETLPA